MHHRFVIAVSMLASLSFSSATQALNSPDGIWTTKDSAPAARSGERAWVQPQTGHYVSVNLESLRELLAAAPKEFSDAARSSSPTIMLPMPEGGFEEFTFSYSPVIDEEAQARFPNIKTYAGQGIDDPTATVRFDLTPAGFHAMIRRADRDAVYVDPYWKGDVENYTAYYKRDYVKPGLNNFQCLFHDSETTPDIDPAAVAAARASTGTELRTFRLAVGATGEYTAFHGGTVDDAFAAITTSVNRVNEVYETEFAVRLILVAGSTSAIFTSAASDPFTNDDPDALISQSQSQLTSRVGTANFDVGHTVSTGAGGLAGLGVICSASSKARGVTGTDSPIGDAYDIDYFAHELGHQFGGDHSFNGVTLSCSGSNRNSSTAYEKGSGSTIMCYAGICGSDNLQTHSDPYFHFIGFEQIATHVASRACRQVIATGNNAPTVNAGLAYTIPKSTYFALTATGTDPDGDPLTYCWEQRDLGAAQALSATDNGTSPLFRSFSPTTSPTRLFPRLTTQNAGSTTTAERLPTLARAMKFRVTARDNRSGGGGVNSANVTITVDGTAGPFAVTSPNTSTAQTGGSSITVTWDVAGTNATPVNTANVRILLSLDAGSTYSTVLAESTPNDGSEVVTLPNTAAVNCRVKIEAVDNIYYDISNSNFRINAGTTTPTPTPTATATPTPTTATPTPTTATPTPTTATPTPTTATPTPTTATPTPTTATPTPTPTPTPSGPGVLWFLR